MPANAAFQIRDFPFRRGDLHCGLRILRDRRLRARRPAGRARADVEAATHYHFANICDIGNALIDAGVPQVLWPFIGAEALVEPSVTFFVGGCKRCGLGFEIALVLPVLMALRRLTRRPRLH